MSVLHSIGYVLGTRYSTPWKWVRVYRTAYGWCNKVIFSTTIVSRLVIVKFCRDYIWTDEEVYSMTQFMEYLRTWSAYQTYAQSNGKDAAEEILHNFVSKYYSTFLKEIYKWIDSFFRSALDSINKSAEPVEKVMLCLKRRYFLLMGRNSK